MKSMSESVPDSDEQAEGEFRPESELVGIIVWS